MVPYADQTKSYKPDLRYLNEGTTNSLASRLAHKLHISLKETYPSSDTAGIPEQRVDHSVAQRRAARLARESQHLHPSERRDTHHASRELSAGPQGRSAHIRHQFDDSDNVKLRQNRRDRATPPPNFGYGSQQYQRDSLISSDKAGVEWRAGRGMAAGHGAARVTPVPTHMRTVQPGEVTGDEENSDKEESYEEENDEDVLLEDGGWSEPAEFQGPDANFVDLDDVFGGIPSRLHSVSPRQVGDSVVDRQRVHKSSDGDYVRFAPHSCHDFLLSHHKLSPTKHIQLVLSKRGDVPITARQRASGIVESLLGEARTISVQRG